MLGEEMKVKYPQPHSLRKYFDSEADIDRIHNTIKHGEKLKRYQVYLKPLRRKSNKHRTRMYG